MDQNKLYKKYIKYKIKFLELKLKDEKNFKDSDEINLYKEKVKNMKGGFFSSIFGFNNPNRKTIFNESDLRIYDEANEFWNNTMERILDNFTIKKHINNNFLDSVKDLFDLSDNVDILISKIYGSQGITPSSFNKKEYYKVYVYKKLKNKKFIFNQLKNKDFCDKLYYDNLYYILTDFGYNTTEKHIKIHRLKILFNTILSNNNFEEIKKSLNCKQEEFLKKKIKLIKCDNKNEDIDNYEGNYD